MRAWKNKDNSEFYDSLPEEGLALQARKAGLGDGEDFQALQPLFNQLPLNQGTRVLEVGAGVGRWVALLLRHFPLIKITALERSLHNLETLHQRFSGWPNVRLWHEDLMTAKTSEPFHLAFWMFAGIVEFHPSERVGALARIGAMLSPNGLLFLDMVGEISKEIPTAASEEGSIEVTIGDSIIHIQVPSVSELATQCEQAGFTVAATVEYTSGKGLKRTILVLQNEIRL